MPNSQLTSLPNLVTYGRIAAVPVCCLLIAPDIYWLRWLALIVFIAAAASDWVDGYLARKLDQGSALGRMLDPIADKLLVNALLIVLAWDRSFSAVDLVPAIAIVLRETFIPGLREYLGNAQITVPVTPLAKWKTTTQLVALGFVIAEYLVPGLGLISDILLWVAAALTVWTGADYFQRSWPHLK